jgi:hypothetical protein
MTNQLSTLNSSVISFAFLAKISDAIQALPSLLSTFFNTSDSGRSAYASSHASSASANMKRNFKKNRLFYIPLALIGLVLLFGVYSMVKNAGASSSIPGVSDERLELKKPLATQNLNKTFAFPLKDAAGKEVSKIQYTLEKAELRDEIIVKGQRATSVKGRTFLIIPIKITNSFNQPIELNVRDYVRLTINNSNEKLAPDIHNDPVEVQAISTKQTRLGFPVDDDVKSLVLQVGEINGSKENIKLDLKK